MEHKEDIGKLILRVTLAVLMLFHGIAKIGHLGGITKQMANHGLPEFLAYSVYLGEIVAPIMLLIGFRVKIAALVMSAMIVVASYMVYADKVFALGKHGAYALELQVFYIMVGIAIFFLGNDRYCLDAKRDQTS